jgi:hypothetical protein
MTFNETGAEIQASLGDPWRDFRWISRRADAIMRS